MINNQHENRRNVNDSVELHGLHHLEEEHEQEGILVEALVVLAVMVVLPHRVVHVVHSLVILLFLRLGDFVVIDL